MSCCTQCRTHGICSRRMFGIVLFPSNQVVKDRTAYLQAGGGIVYDSHPAEEYEESMNKMKALVW